MNIDNTITTDTTNNIINIEAEELSSVQGDGWQLAGADQYARMATANLTEVRDTLRRALLEDDWNTLLEGYKLDKQVGGRNTLRTYDSALRRFFNWKDAQGVTLREVNKAVILEFLSFIRSQVHPVGLKRRGERDGKAYSSLTVNLYSAAVRGFYEWTEEAQVFPNVASGVHCRKERVEGAYRKMHLTKDEADTLLEYFRLRSKRDYAIASLMIRRGLRTVEISEISFGDFVWLEGVRVLRFRGKGHADKVREVQISDDLKANIDDYVASTGRQGVIGEPVFLSESRNGSNGGRLSANGVQRIIKRGLVECGLKGGLYSPHSLRHTTGVLILQGGGNIYDVQTVLGHASTSTSENYVESARVSARRANPPERFIDGGFAPQDADTENAIHI